MNSRKICLFAFALVFACSYICPAYSVQKTQPQTTKSAVITVPAGEVIHSVLTTPINSKNAMQGHIVTLVLSEDFYYNGKMILPADSVVSGTVISVKKAQDESASDRVLLRFNQIVTPYGIQIPIFALLQTGDKSGFLNGNHEYFGSDDGRVIVDVGTPFSLLLNQPITVNPEVYNSNY